MAAIGTSASWTTWAGISQDENAFRLFSHFERVIEWAQELFPKPRKYMTGLDWGALYLDHGDDIRDPVWLEEQLTELEKLETIKHTGIVPYLLSGDEQHLGYRLFTEKQKRGQ